MIQTNYNVVNYTEKVEKTGAIMQEDTIAFTYSL